MINTPPLRAIVVGATGSTGTALIRLLVQHQKIQHVRAVSRRVIDEPQKVFNISSEEVRNKLSIAVVDYDNLEKSVEDFQGFHLGFCTLGTTRKDAGSAEKFYLIDYTYTLNSAQMMKAGGVKHFSLLTSQGASASSWLLYAKTKGEIENAVSKVGFNRVSIFRPGLLQRPGVQRVVERIGLMILPSFMTVSVHRLAESMVINALSSSISIISSPSFEIVEHAQIRDLLVPLKHEAMDTIKSVQADINNSNDEL